MTWMFLERMKAWLAILWAIGWSALLVGGGQQSRPLPDRATFLAEARKRLASDERLQSRYTFKDRRTEMRPNDAGTWVAKETKLYEVYPSPVPELTYLRLVEYNGNPVGTEALAEADREQLEEVADYRRKISQESPRDRARRLAREAQAAAKDEAMVEDAISTLRFDLVRREVVDGRPMIVVSFTPKPDAHPETREGKVVQHFTGLAWVDEEERQFARAEAHAVDAIWLGWGILARFDKGMRGETSRRRMADGTWLPVRDAFTGSGWIFLFKKIQIGYVNEYFDYQKIDPDKPPRFVALSDADRR